MGMPWLQQKQYQCPTCGTRYLHDKAHYHAVFECPFRPAMKKRIVIPEKVYEPRAGR